MEIGNQIKTLRTRRGITQEALSAQLGVTAQAVSKWERGAALPDIELLPQLSAFFGVTIDELFALSDDTRMERIQNMLWDVRYLDPGDVEASREFLLAKARREQENGRPYELLADMENHLANMHRERAAEYAKTALGRDESLIEAHEELVIAMEGKCWDWCYKNHNALIRYYQTFLKEHPDNWHAMIWLMEQLLDDYRFEEAEAVMHDFEACHDSFRIPLYRGILLWHKGQKEAAYHTWQAAALEYPDRWNIPSTIGDYLARDGKYREAIVWQQKAMEVLPAPRYVDPWESVAHLYELLGDPQSAIATLEAELSILAADWQTTEGETADVVRRKIARLRG